MPTGAASTGTKTGDLSDRSEVAGDEDDLCNTISPLYDDASACEIKQSGEPLSTVVRVDNSATDFDSRCTHAAPVPHVGYPSFVELGGNPEVQTQGQDRVSDGTSV
jgi:hypothetical protein